MYPRSIRLALAVAMLLFALSQAQLNSLPPCALSCALPAIGATGCDLSNFACICSSSMFINGITGCIKTSCTDTEIKATLVAAGKLCADAGAPLPANIGGDTTSSSTLSVAPPTTSSAAPSTSSASVVPSSSSTSSVLSTSASTYTSASVSASTPTSAPVSSTSSSAVSSSLSSAPSTSSASASASASSTLTTSVVVYTSVSANTTVTASTNAPTVSAFTGGASSVKVGSLLGAMAAAGMLFAL